MTVKDTLIELRTLFEVPAHWTQGESAKRANGIPVDPCDVSAACWCVMGGLSKVTAKYELGEELYNDAIDILYHEIPRGTGLVAWNDDPLRTHDEVIQLMDKAIAKADQ